MKSKRKVARKQSKINPAGNAGRSAVQAKLERKSALNVGVSGQGVKQKYVKPALEKHGDVHLWAFGTLGG